MEHDNRIRDPCRLLIGPTRFLYKTVARKRGFNQSILKEGLINPVFGVWIEGIEDFDG